nr:prolyl oligopeptidase family serine peptidase [uncultured Allomuricauda sp.]
MKKLKTLLLMVIIFSVTPILSQSNREFISIDMTVKSVSSTIEGTLFTPDSTKVLPLIIIVPGSGKVTHSQITPMVKGIFNGILTNIFVYDKRGVGDSTGDYIGMNAETSAERIPIRTQVVLDIVDFLYEKPFIDKERIGLMGSSQGGWISPLAAYRSSKISFAICISGVACSVGVSDYFSDLVKEMSIEMATGKLNSYNGVQGYDPSEALRNIDIPILWIYGGKDKSKYFRLLNFIVNVLSLIIVFYLK